MAATQDAPGSLGLHGCRDAGRRRAAEQGEALLQAGAYEVEVRLELPNVLSRGPDSTTTICIPYSGTNGALPVLSANNPLATCPPSNVGRDGATPSTDMVEAQLATAADLRKFLSSAILACRARSHRDRPG